MVKLVSEKPQGGVNYILDTWSSIPSSIEDNHLYLSTSDEKSILFNREIFCFLSPFLSGLIKATFQGSWCLATYFDTTIILPDVSSKAVYDLKSLMIKGTVSGLSGYDAKELKSLYSFLGFESRIIKEENDDEITVEHEYRIEDDKTDGDGGYDDYNDGDEANKDDRFLKIGSRGVDVNDGTVQMSCGDEPIRSSEEEDDDVDMIDRENITNSHDEFEENEDLSSTTLDLNAKNDERVEKMADEDVYIPSSSTEKDNDANPDVPHGTGPHGSTSNSLALSPSSGVNTPIGPPASQEDREYLDKVKQLEKYIEPLRRKIMEIGNEDQDKLAKMKKLLDILSNPDKRMPLGTLLKCEDILKRLDTVEPEENEDKSTENRTTPDIIGQAEEPTLASKKVMENPSVMEEDLNEGGGDNDEEGNLTHASSENRHTANSSEITGDYKNFNMNCFVKIKKFKKREGELNELDETNVKETIPSYEVSDRDPRRLRLRKIPGTSNTISSIDPDNEEELDNEGESNMSTLPLLSSQHRHHLELSPRYAAVRQPETSVLPSTTPPLAKIGGEEEEDEEFDDEEEEIELPDGEMLGEEEREDSMSWSNDVDSTIDSFFGGHSVFGSNEMAVKEVKMNNSILDNSLNGANKNKMAQVHLDILIPYFEEFPQPTTEQKLELAEQTGLTKQVIQRWFANRRFANRRRRFRK